MRSTSAAISRPSTAATRSLSATASIPSSPRTGSWYTGGPPPPHATTMWPRATKSRIMSRSTTATGRGLGASRRQRPGSSSRTGTPRAGGRGARLAPRRSSPGSRRRNLARGRGGSKRAPALLEQLPELPIVAAECLEITGGESGVGLCGEVTRFLPPPGERGVRREPVAAPGGQEVPQGGPRPPALPLPAPPREEDGGDSRPRAPAGRL